MKISHKLAVGGAVVAVLALGAYRVALAGSPASGFNGGWRPKQFLAQGETIETAEYVTQRGDTLAGLAARYLGDAELAANLWTYDGTTGAKLAGEFRPEQPIPEGTVLAMPGDAIDAAAVLGFVPGRLAVFPDDARRRSIGPAYMGPGQIIRDFVG